MALKPAKGWVLLEEQKSKDDLIILSEEAQKRMSEWVIVAIAKDSQFKKGESVIFDNKAIQRNDISSIKDKDTEKEYWICPESAVIATR